MTASAVAAKETLGRHECDRCGRAFARPSYLALHQGRDHPRALSPEERSAFEAAVAEEEAWLLNFRRHVKGGLNTLPIVVIYLLILLLVAISGVNILFGLLLAPGAVGFGALLYWMAYSKDGGG